MSGTEREPFESGQENSSNGNFPDRQMEAQPGVFESGRPSIEGSGGNVPEDELIQYGDSRPDQLEGGGFVDVSEHPMMTTNRNPEDQPEVRKEDPEFLEAHRVDQEDEIVGQPAGPEFDQEIAILRPRISKKGAESSQL